MNKGRCKSCGSKLFIPDGTTTDIKCNECGAMNLPIPIVEKSIRIFSIIHLKLDKLFGFSYCYVLWKGWGKQVTGLILLMIMVSIFLIYILAQENPLFGELRDLNKQASMMVFNGQPEIAINLYDTMLSKLHQQKPNNKIKQWITKTKAYKSKAIIENEKIQIDKYILLINKARKLSSQKQFIKSRKIYDNVLHELKLNDKKGKLMNNFIGMIEREKRSLQ